MGPSTHHASRILKLVCASWPSFITVKPADVGMFDNIGTLLFLRVVQQLCDEGYLSYEALVVDQLGPRIIDASITARGRLLLAQATPDAAIDVTETSR